MDNHNKKVLDCLEFLKQLKSAIEIEPTLDIIAFSDSRFRSKHIIKIIIDGGLIEDIGSSSLKKWRWKTILPNIHMASRTLETLKKYKVEKPKKYTLKVDVADLLKSFDLEKNKKDYKTAINKNPSEILVKIDAVRNHLCKYDKQITRNFIVEMSDGLNNNYVFSDWDYTGIYDENLSQADWDYHSLSCFNMQNQFLNLTDSENFTLLKGKFMRIKFRNDEDYSKPALESIGHVSENEWFDLLPIIPK